MCPFWDKHSSSHGFWGSPSSSSGYGCDRMFHEKKIKCLSSVSIDYVKGKFRKHHCIRDVLNNRGEFATDENYDGECCVVIASNNQQPPVSMSAPECPAYAVVGTATDGGEYINVEESSQSS